MDNYFTLLLLLLSLQLCVQSLQIIAASSDGMQQISSLVTVSIPALCLQFLNLVFKIADFFFHDNYFSEEMNN